MTIEILNCTRQAVDRRTMEKVIFETLKLLKVQGDVSLSVTLVGDKKMRALNKAWRKKDAITDVLSFSFLEVKDWPAGGAQGEVIICLPYAKKQARRYGISEKRNIALLAAHGVIHIFGIDHERSEKERKITETIQKKAMEAI